MKRTIAIALAMASSAAFADVVVPMHMVDAKGAGAGVGQVTISESRYGLVFTPALQGLSPGIHGFHVHQNPSCEPQEKDGAMVAAGAAGGHYDPAATNVHGAPWGDGHLGDLPALYVDANGSAAQPVLAQPANPTQGTPCAIASAITFGKPSQREGRASRRACAYSELTLSVVPGSSTRPDKSSSAIRFSRSLRSTPSPTIRKIQSGCFGASKANAWIRTE